MLGDEAFRLAKEAKDIATDHIPAYNEEQVRLVTQETRYLWTRIEEMIASLNTAVANQKQTQFLRSLLWTLHLASSMIPASVSLRLSPEEQNYVRDYARLNSTYRDAIENQLCPSDSLNWTADGELPPRDLFIEVRVIKDCGEIVTENGVVNLQVGTQHYLHRSDVEHLVTIGYLEHVNPS
ncbi:DNA replication protein psf1 [Coemansia furcata]|uniref:DNA replication protein psf1 n=1 Tax=Coemansia furcata TaxID=417177 RepID=A0ACC1KRC3_9FUNG|nr:DNA replication protein psf1 [Coemansia furcata]